MSRIQVAEPTAEHQAGAAEAPIGDLERTCCQVYYTDHCTFYSSDDTVIDNFRKTRCHDVFQWNPDQDMEHLYWSKSQRATTGNR